VDALIEYAADYARLRPATRFFSYFVGDKSDDKRDFYVSPERDFSSERATIHARDLPEAAGFHHHTR